MNNALTQLSKVESNSLYFPTGCGFLTDRNVNEKYSYTILCLNDGLTKNIRNQMKEKALIEGRRVNKQINWKLKPNRQTYRYFPICSKLQQGSGSKYTIVTVALKRLFLC